MHQFLYSLIGATIYALLIKMRPIYEKKIFVFESYVNSSKYLLLILIVMGVEMNKTIRIFLLFVSSSLFASCGGMNIQPAELAVDAQPQLNLIQWDVPHTNLTMLLPDGWVSEYYQGTIAIASDSRNFFYSPSDPFEGVLVHMFLSDGPRAVGPSFDVMQIAADYIADQPNVVQAPTLVEQGGRKIITTIHMNKDSKGDVITYLTGYVLEDQQLAVFLATTPADIGPYFLPILQEMLYSIMIASQL